MPEQQNFIPYGRILEIAEEAYTGHGFDGFSRFLQMLGVAGAAIPDGMVLVDKSDLIEEDSYGVYGSEFYVCKLCRRESGAGILNNGIDHDESCPLAATPTGVGEKPGDRHG